MVRRLPITFRRHGLAALAASALIGAASIASPAVVIRFAPGPPDGEEIITPWGIYVAVFEGDHVWVGTRAEYQDNLARADIRDAGYREFCQTGKSHCNEFVEGDLPRVSVGSNELASLTVYALYEVDKAVAVGRGHQAPGTEYVEVTWVQSGAGRVRSFILDEATKASYSPHDCGVDGGFHHCDFVMPRAALTHPAGVFFVGSNERPGVLPGRSIAWLAYGTISEHLRSLARDRIKVSPADPDDDSWRTLTRLHGLDPAIPTSP